MKLSTVIGDDIKSRYLAFVIDEETRTKLFTLIPPKYERKFCHHITLKLKALNVMTDDECKMLGKPATVIIKDIRDDGQGVQVLAVTFNGKSERPDGSFYHITYSLSHDRKPVESNKLKDLPGIICKVPISIGGIVYLVKR